MFMSGIGGAYRCRILLCCSPVGRQRDMIVGCQDVQHVPVEDSMESSLGGLTKNNTSGKGRWRFQPGPRNRKARTERRERRTFKHEGRKGKTERSRHKEDVELTRSSRREQMRWDSSLGEVCQTLTNLTIWQTLLMDPRDADDTAAYTADILLVSVDASPRVTGYSRATQPMGILYGWTGFLHVDRFHPYTANHLPLELHLL